jgi:hypothetical protein
MEKIVINLKKRDEIINSFVDSIINRIKENASNGYATTKLDLDERVALSEKKLIIEELKRRLDESRTKYSLLTYSVIIL